VVLGAAAGGVAGAAVSVISEFQAHLDPKLVGWGSGSSWLSAVSFLGAAAGLLLLAGKPHRGRPGLSVGAAAGLGAGTSATFAAFLLLPYLGSNLAVLLIGVGFVLVCGTSAAFVATYISGYVNRRTRFDQSSS
jgi:hypothetical protein